MGPGAGRARGDRRAPRAPATATPTAAATRCARRSRSGTAWRSSQVVVGNGADGVLNYLALALLEPGDEVAFCWPSFPVYPINAAKMGAVAVRAPLAGSSYDLDALAACVSERTKIVYVTNPNNPTGGMVTRAALERFLDGLPEHVLPVLDEAYFEYIDDPEYPDGASEQLAQGRRCVVLRTFSKIYGLAGFRVGYGLCPPDVAAACLKVKNAFDVTQSALDAALASLDARDEVARRRDETRAGRERLAAGLRERGFEPLDGRRQLPLRRGRRRRRVRLAARAAGRDRAAARAVRRSRPRCASAWGLRRSWTASSRLSTRADATAKPAPCSARSREGWDVLAISGGIAAALVAAAVAVGAGTDVRIHRLHVPPPPVGDDSGTSVPPAPGKPNSDQPDGPLRPGYLSAGRPAAPGCAAASSTCRLPRSAAASRATLHGANVTGTLSDYAIALSAPSVAAAPTLQLPRHLPGGGRHPQPGAPRRGLDQAVRHEQPRRRPGRHVHGHEPAARQLPALCTIHAAFGMTKAFTVN